MASVASLCNFGCDRADKGGNRFASLEVIEFQLEGVVVPNRAPRVGSSDSAFDPIEAPFGWLPTGYDGLGAYSPHVSCLMPDAS